MSQVRSHLLQIYKFAFFESFKKYILGTLLIDNPIKAAQLRVFLK